MRFSGALGENDRGRKRALISAPCAASTGFISVDGVFAFCDHISDRKSGDDHCAETRARDLARTGVDPVMNLVDHDLGGDPINSRKPTARQWDAKAIGSNRCQTSLR